MARKRVIVFASGTPTGGGSGFQELFENTMTGVLSAEIVAVVSQHEQGGVRQRAHALGVPFVHFKKTDDPDAYKKCVTEYHADFSFLSGWSLFVQGLNPQTTINIHPAPLPDFGGKGMYGLALHERVIKAYKKGSVTHTAVSMHFTTEVYDEGAVFFHFPIFIRHDDDAHSLQARVLKIEHAYQPWVSDLVVQGEIQWDGSNPSSLTVPQWYPFLP